ncbi:hypothetical protein ACH50O_20270 [Methylomonas sp. 2BW1-5-20]|uniref:hypothetical protein n=1 Tax=Methylomonas sp. 2BW1-5-20 TaxID=3376686 RepID=UPI004051F1A7
MFLIRWTILLAILALALFKGVNGTPDLLEQREESLALALLVPDDANLDDPKLTAWLDAAQEEGIKLDVLTASEFMRPFPFSLTTYAGLILPDSIHVAMSETLIDSVHGYVSAGGKLLLVFDAGTLLFPNQTYAKDKSLFSDLAGVEYALYDTLRDDSIKPTQVLGEQSVFLALHNPPGRFSASPSGAGGMMSLSSYKNDKLEYPHFLTQGRYAGKSLLYGEDQTVIAGINDFNSGKVLFVNLPLGYLKNRTDSALLHGFLRYFSENIVNLPTLSASPSGRGGLIVNLHIDSNANLPVLAALKKQSKLFDYGPYSVHITAGPDVNVDGDKLGFNIQGNKEAGEWLGFFQRRGDQIGSHGGWIHNYFGEYVADTNREEFLPFLEKNKQAIEAVSHVRITEYSAPMGNHPNWVTQWLDSQKINSYYFTGDIGLGPTKPYRDGSRGNQNAWAFPVLSMGKYAAFEEMHADGIEEKKIDQWLNEVSNYAADDRVIRLMYFHPPGLLHYPKAADNWLLKSSLLNKQGRFAWYTMTDIANFMEHRNQTAWNIKRVDSKAVTLFAQHPESLSRLTWMFPKSAYENAEIQSGKANISMDDKYIVIEAQDVKSLQVKLYMRSITRLY